VTQAGTGFAATLMGGNVGIGTTNPGETLDVAGAIKFGANGVASSAATVSGRLGTYTGGSGNYTQYNFIQPATGKALAIWNANSSLVAAFGINGSDTDMRSVFNGNVGIGTTNPGALLDVRGSTSGNANISGFVYGSTNTSAFTDPAGLTRTKATLVVGSNYTTKQRQYIKCL